MAMETGQSPSKNTSRAKLYFSIGIGLLFVLSIVWSIDNALIFILTGLIIFFIVLGIYHSDFSFENTRAPIESPFPDNAQNISRKKEITYSSKPTPTAPRTRTNRALILSIATGLFITIVAFTFVIISSSDEDSEADFSFQEGEYFYQQEKYDSASIFYRQAFTLNPKHAEALTGYGNALMMSDQYDSAIILYDKALAANPDYDKASYQKGAVLSYQKNYDQSISELKKLLKTNPSYFDAMQLIGDDYYNTQKYDSALRWYEDAYKNGLRNRYLFHLMGYIQETKGNTTKAIDLYEEALQYDSSVLDIYQRLGVLIPGPKGNSYRERATALEQVNEK